MGKIWFGLVFVALTIAAPAAAQDFNKNIMDCLKAAGGIRIITSDPHQYRWYFPSEALNKQYMDCVGRKAAEAPATPTKRPPKRSQ